MRKVKSTITSIKGSVKMLLKMLSQHIIFPFCYNLYRRRPVNRNRVILTDAHKSVCPVQMQQLKKALLKQNFEVVECYFDLARLGTLAGMRRMMGFMKLYAQAGFVILQDNFLPVASCRKRRETKVIQLWHGCGAFKKFGYDAADDIPAGYKGNVYRNYDLVPVSSENCVPFFESAMGITRPKVVFPIGVSYTDVYFDEAYKAEMKKRFYALHPEATGKTVVLWAPSFRGNAADAGIGDIPGEHAVDSLAQNEKLYVIKSLHPHMLHHRGMEQPAMSTGELMFGADILVTDYSSIFFEYLLLDRPIIFFATDQREYESTRGYYLSYSTLPGHIVRDEAWLQQAVQHIQNEMADGNDTYAKARAVFREKYMRACDGNATERVMRYIRGKR